MSNSKSTNDSVDILLATYNGSAYLEQLLDSILRQTWTKWRILVSDDCSTDDTLDIIERYRKKMTDRIVVVSQDLRHGGAKENFMHLINPSTANYAAFCDQDDVWHPDKLEVLMQEMHRQEQEYGEDVPLLIFSDLEITDDALNTIAPSYYSYSHNDPGNLMLPSILAQNQIPGCAMLLNRSLCRIATMCSRVQHIVMHDWWVVLIAITLGSASFVRYPLIRYRQHAGNTVGARSYNVLDRGISGILSSCSGLLDRQHECYVQRLRQADAFLTTYRSKLNEKDCEIIQGYIQMLQKRGVTRARQCFIGQYWQTGTQRKVRQLAYLLSSRQCVLDEKA